MNGVHDMGGMHGFGPMVIDPNDGPGTLAEWEKRVDLLGQVALGAGFFNLDAFRYGIELMDPARYLATPYFGRWMETIERNMIQEGAFTREELDGWIETLRSNPEAQASPGAKPVARPATTPGEPLPATPPRFSAGDVVMTRNINHSGHTRLPRYARLKRGVIERVYEPEPFADAGAENRSVPMQHTYRVRFDARDLWGDEAEPNAFVTLDLYDSYLEPAETA
jgi:nitrile hydratase beta subunit